MCYLVRENVNHGVVFPDYYITMEWAKLALHTDSEHSTATKHYKSKCILPLYTYSEKFPKNEVCSNTFSVVHALLGCSR